MVDLFCAPFVDLIHRMRLEFRNQQAIFDLPAAALVVAARKLPQRPISRSAFTIASPATRRPRLGPADADGPKSGPLLARRLRGSWS